MSNDNSIGSDRYMKIVRISEELLGEAPQKIEDIKAISPQEDWSYVAGLNFAKEYLSNLYYTYSNVYGVLSVDCSIDFDSYLASGDWEQEPTVNTILSSEAVFRLIEMLKELKEEDTQYSRIAEEIYEEMTGPVIKGIAHTSAHLDLLSFLLTEYFSEKIDKEKTEYFMDVEFRELMTMELDDSGRELSLKKVTLLVFAGAISTLLLTWLCYIIDPQNFSVLDAVLCPLIMFFISVIGCIIVSIAFNFTTVPNECIAIEKEISSAFSDEVLVLIKGSDIKPNKLFIEFPQNEKLAKLTDNDFFSKTTQDVLNKNASITFDFINLPQSIKDKFSYLVKENSYETFKMAVKNDSLDTLWEQLSAYLNESLEGVISEHVAHYENMETSKEEARAEKAALNKELINRAALELSLHREERNQVKDLILNKTRHNIKDEEVKEKMV